MIFCFNLAWNSIGWWPWCSDQSCLLGESEIAGSNATLASVFQIKKYPPLTHKNSISWGASVTDSVLGLRPSEFRILYLEGSVIAFISQSSGGYPGLVWPICAQRWPFIQFHLKTVYLRFQRHKDFIRVNPYSAGIDFSRQNLTSVDVRFWRLKIILSL